MRKGKSIIGVGAILVGCVVVNSASRVAAAPIPTTSTALPPGQELADAKYSYYRIPLRNVSPDLMAWWIDPQHNTKPELIKESERVVAEFFLLQQSQQGKYAPKGQNATQQTKDAGREKLRKGLFTLPATADLLVPVPAQSALLIHATAEGRAKLEKIVQYLDVPLRQIEIEAQLVAISREDTKVFGLGMENGGFLSKDYHLTLNTLIKQGKAQLIANPHFIATNNIALSDTTDTRLTDVTVEPKSKAAQFMGDVQATRSTAGSPFFIATRYKLTLTATVNNDDTVTLRVAPLVGSILTSAIGNGAIPVAGSQWIDTTAILHDGDTFVMSGLSIHGNEPPTPEHQMMIFITPRIIRQATNQDAATQSQTTAPKPAQP